MTLFDALRISRGPAFVLMATGVYWGGLAGMMPDVKAHVAASDGVMGAVLVAPAAASILAMGAAPWAARRYGGYTLPVAAILIALTLLLYLVADTPLALAGALFAGGFAVAFADMTANIRIAHVEARRDVHLMNLNHAAYSFSFAITALLIAGLRGGGWDFRTIAMILSGVALAYAVLGWDSRDPSSGDDEAESGPARPPMIVVLLAGGMLFCSFVAENATEGWTALFIERTLGGAVGEGSFGPAVFGFVMGAARLSGQALVRRLGAERLILSSAVLAVIGAIVIALSPSQIVMHGGVVLTALGVAVIVPSTNSILARKVKGPARSIAISRAWMLGLMGFFIGPALMGGLAELGSLRLSFAAVAVSSAAIIPAVLALSRR
ncbi:MULTISPECIES: MFS transporter [Maritimibacter]|uniref:Major facilitator superfamily (MFS) transporter n=1 Tax=Maritimibacter alkaliphilus HTCC2654 TaxID=314271 RepID=A3V9J3_9RHOB|nr:MULTISPECIES: MFS transporter [Maritimibacter]EAQ14584.1 Major facilitator superfamily (MFS) transporter [Maritimibacter alkaliphilus HTCC2654]TYP82244.1 MFS transporter [Maritimibacter alkaliphilus HTCC2654]